MRKALERRITSFEIWMRMCGQQELYSSVFNALIEMLGKNY